MWSTTFMSCIINYDTDDMYGTYNPLKLYMTCLCTSYPIPGSSLSWTCMIVDEKFTKSKKNEFNESKQNLLALALDCKYCFKRYKDHHDFKSQQSSTAKKTDRGWFSWFGKTPRQRKPHTRINARVVFYQSIFTLIEKSHQSNVAKHTKYKIRSSCVSWIKINRGIAALFSALQMLCSYFSV